MGAGFYGENEGNGGTPSVPASGGDSSLKEGALELRLPKWWHYGGRDRARPLHGVLL